MRGLGEDREEREARIKRFLLSGNAENVSEGIRELHELYCQCVPGYIRAWSKAHGLWISSDDLLEIWNETLVSVFLNVKRGNFKPQGQLTGYLSAIARRRTIDIQRRRMTKREKISFDAIDETTFHTIGENGRQYDGSSNGMAEWVEEVEACYDRLSPGQQLVVRLDVVLFVQNGRPPSLDELTDEVNRHYEPTLTKKAVQLRRARGWRRLREIVEERENRG